MRYGVVVFSMIWLVGCTEATVFRSSGRSLSLTSCRDLHWTWMCSDISTEAEQSSFSARESLLSGVGFDPDGPVLTNCW